MFEFCLKSRRIATVVKDILLCFDIAEQPHAGQGVDLGLDDKGCSLDL